MNIPNPRETSVRVFVDRYFLSYLVDTDGAALVDTDDTLLGVTPLVRTPVEVTDRVRNGRVSLGDVSAVGSSHAGVDSAVTVLSLTLDHGEPSLAPGAESPLNEPDELLRPYRPVRVLAYDGEEPPVTLFSGYLGDEIRSNASAAAATLSLTARDLAKPLQDLFISEFPIIAEGASDANPVPVDDVLGELLALVPEHLRPQLDVLSPVTLSVREPYRPQNVSVWDAMQQVAIQSGWYLGVRGESLVFLDPPRDKVTPDVTLDTDDAFTDDLGISDTDVRNVVQVAFTDGVTRERVVVEQRDEWSIENITGGLEKRSLIELDETSQIDTLAEAQALAGAFISDMSREFASTQLTLPFLPSLWLFDVIEMTHEKFTRLPRVFAVHSVQHTFDRTRNRTVVAGVGQVIGKRRAWLNREPRPGSPSDPRGPHQSVLPAPIVSVTHGNPGIIVNVDQRRGVDAEWVQVYMSTTPGFIPSPATLVAEGDQEQWVFASTSVSDPAHFLPGVAHHIRVRSVDSKGNPGRFTAQHSITPDRIDPGLILLDGNVRVTGDVTVYGGGNTGSFRVVRGGNEVLKLGNIAGKPGVPSGVVEGLWGEAGAGVFIQGLPILERIIPYQVAIDSEFFPNGTPAGTPFTPTIDSFETALPNIEATDTHWLAPLLLLGSVWSEMTQSVGGFETATPGYVAMESHDVRPFLRRSNGTWTSGPSTDAAGTVYNRVRFQLRLTANAVQDFPAPAGLSFGATGTLLLFLVPRNRTTNP